MRFILNGNRERETDRRNESVITSEDKDLDDDEADHGTVEDDGIVKWNRASHCYGFF